ncbi:hypothetical protein P5673_009148, partial [Acropora cervicornis]
SGSGPDKTRQDKLPHDVTSKQGLTDLYNSGVVSVEHVTRPLGGSGGSLGIEHSGVVLTSSSGETVVTNAKHMSGNWKSAGTQTAKPGTRVADYVQAGGSEYNVAFDNCHHGSKRMMDVAKPK